MLQGSLLREKSIFTSFDMNDMEKANANLQSLYWSHKPGQLLFIVNKIKQIGQK